MAFSAQKLLVRLYVLVCEAVQRENDRTEEKEKNWLACSNGWLYDGYVTTELTIEVSWIYIGLSIVRFNCENNGMVSFFELMRNENNLCLHVQNVHVSTNVNFLVGAENRK